MIHFVWSSIYPLFPGVGGTEVYTVGQARELQRRGIACDILTIGHGKKDGRKYFPDLTFRNVSLEDISQLDGTCIFVSEALPIQTKEQSYVIIHCPPSMYNYRPEELEARLQDKKIIVTSFAAAEIWAKHLGMMRSNLSVVYPFADPAFGQAKQTHSKNPTVLFAGRLVPEKGIYTLLAALHDHRLDDYDFKAVKASTHTPQGKMILKLLKTHPRIKLVDARENPADMAELLASCDVLVMPTSSQLFTETFGMLSIEAQHAGCRVVASDSGGLPETNIGGLTLIEPDNVPVLAGAIAEAVKQGRLSEADRAHLTQYFTLTDSVDNLLKAIEFNQPAD